MKKSLFILLLLFSKLFAVANQNGDFQIWNQMIFETKTATVISPRFTCEARWGDNASTLFFAYAQAQLVYVKKYFEIAPGYRQRYSLRSGEWVNDYEPMVDITLFFSGSWKLEDRNRIFYIIPEHIAPSHWLYRNRVSLTSPEIAFLRKLKLSIQDEVFVREATGFSQNRFLFGFVKDISESVTGRFQYMYRNIKRSDTWIYQNVLFLQFIFIF